MYRVLFILPVSGGSGGAHSVMQEADAMRAIGIDARIAANGGNAAQLRHVYGDLHGIGANIVAYEGSRGLAAILDTIAPDVAIATTNQSVHILAAALKSSTSTTRAAYYVQDYEPLFYPPDSGEWAAAYASYTAIPGMLLFAKTRWLQEIVVANHGGAVAKVEPSIDHAVFHPALGRLSQPANFLSVVAMIRPGTPRRAPGRTARTLDWITAEFGDRVRCASFGCSDEELHDHGLASEGRENLGVLSRREVGDLFRRTDLFLDLSDYQAFGRTSVEAMSCGAMVVVPAHGGAGEFARDRRNAFIVDVRREAAIRDAVRSAMAMSPAERRTMALRAIETGYRYTTERAAVSEIAALFD